MSEQQSKKSDQLAHVLSERIVRGEFQPGEKLRQDSIAREFSVSQVTVREAFTRLSSQGLVISLPRRGICIAPLDQSVVDELQVMRRALEPLALQLSVPNLTPEQIATIELIHLACNASETATDWERENRNFHIAIIEGCKMPRLIAEVSNLQLLYARHFFNHHAPRWKRRDDPDHAAILSAIKARDAKRAHTVMQRHLARLG